MITVQVLKPLEHESRTYQPGERLALLPLQAVLYLRRGLAVLPRRLRPTFEAPIATDLPKKRQYKRKPKTEDEVPVE